MNQYEVQNAARSIDGYYIPRPNEDSDVAFNRAKAETIHNIKVSLANIEALTYQQFLEADTIGTRLQNYIQQKSEIVLANDGEQE